MLIIPSMRKLKMASSKIYKRFPNLKKSSINFNFRQRQKFKQYWINIRISDAFLIEKIVLCGITACPPHKDIQNCFGSTECFMGIL